MIVKRCSVSFKQIVSVIQELLPFVKIAYIMNIAIFAKEMSYVFSTILIKM